MKFEDSKIEEEYLEVKEYCSNKFIDCYYNNLSIFRSEDENNVVLSNSTLLKLYLPLTREDIECRFEDLVYNIQQVKTANFINDYTLLTENEAFIRVTAPRDFNKTITAVNEYSADLILEEIEYIVGLTKGFNSFNLKIIEEEAYNKFVAPYYEDDMYVCIYSPFIKIEHVEEIYLAYFFELKTMFDIELEYHPLVDWDFFDEEEDTKEPSREIRLRPLLHGKGIKEVIDIYARGFNTTFAEHRILSFCRVIEYVSQTVIRKDLIEKATNKLSSNRVFLPDSDFILELGKIFEQHNETRKDYQAFKITVENCCDIYELVKVAPNHLKKTKKITLNSDSKQIEGAFLEIIDSITATRNKLSHAKTNYNARGGECPEEHMEAFSLFLDIVAQQVIRWFGLQKEENRII